MEKYVKLSDVEKMINDADCIFQEMEDYTEVGYIAYDINLERLPVADVAPIRHARWIYRQRLTEEGGYIWDYECSNCHAAVPGAVFDCLIDAPHKEYCGACGAKMDEEEITHQKQK